MNRGSDPWATEKLSRSEAQRRYNNLVIYQLRPMLGNRSMTSEAKVNVMKRMVREAGRIKYESGVVSGSGVREEVVELFEPLLKPESGVSEEMRDWIKRTIRAFGASIETAD
jgi:hypothetical protein